MAELETITYDEADGVARVTLNRPDVHNAFNKKMQEELSNTWRALRTNDDVRCVLLTGAGDKAFCTGIDRMEGIADSAEATGDRPRDFAGRWMFEDPGKDLGPKSNNMWKPVIAAVNGMACGGAFYMLGEVEFIVAADHATFFDPHVTYGMTAAFEPIMMLAKMPFQEIMRLSLLGNHERMSAQRAYEIGMVSEIVDGNALLNTAERAAHVIADQHPLGVMGTVRALWMGRELSRQQAIDMAYLFTSLGTDAEAIAEGQARFSSGERIEWRTR